MPHRAWVNPFVSILCYSVASTVVMSDPSTDSTRCAEYVRNSTQIQWTRHHQPRIRDRHLARICVDSVASTVATASPDAESTHVARPRYNLGPACRLRPITIMQWGTFTIRLVPKSSYAFGHRSEGGVIGVHSRHPGWITSSITQ